ncbi:actin depolymerizing protein [Trametes versicolor FP-101664 SS1]|uniref:actin depolymerizing protein n=1 Tax=Trametes versicolor (strain FP-101664) TaxID=717944 RepID=UPI00046236E6|nr:actin depolymerizing protein [Trametes versicolor FP-101664 SS1]EIW60075.1 actin depolymerizing protein [Trametes versicolor FP-101664 SS1]
MSAPTGITVSPELASAFSDAVDSNNIRFLKVSIENESLVPSDAVAPSGTLEEDLDKLVDILEDNVPAYILVRLDDPPTEWLAIYYVPDNAKVRDKMLYAATRTTLTKSLGSAHFTDNIFATSKDDIGAGAYAKHKRHIAAPPPMSAREKEMEAVKAAEREAGGRIYEGSRARQSHVGQGVGLNWTDEAANAIKELGAAEDSRLVVLSIDPATESLLLTSAQEVDVSGLSSALPASDPSYAFFAWPQNITSPPRRDVVPIYSCPSASAVRHRMLYSSAVLSVVREVKELLSSSGSSSTIASRKVETSDPSELDEKYLIAELGLSSTGASAATAGVPTEGSDKKPFARPKGPGRKR